MLQTLFSALSLVLRGLETVTFSDATICEFQAMTSPACIKQEGKLVAWGAPVVWICLDS